MLQRLKNRLVARLATRFPRLAEHLTKGYDPLVFEDIPWASPVPELFGSTVALVTTAGIHHRGQPPFDMADPEGDPEFRELSASTIAEDFTITHDYYDHRDADRDINVVFPIERLREMAQAGVIGRVADLHYSFMGHIDGRHIDALIRRTAPEVAQALKRRGADIAVLTPG